MRYITGFLTLLLAIIFGIAALVLLLPTIILVLTAIAIIITSVLAFAVPTGIAAFCTAGFLEAFRGHGR